MRRLHLCRSTATLLLGVAIALTGCSYAKEKVTKSTEDKITQITEEISHSEMSDEKASVEGAATEIVTESATESADDEVVSHEEFSEEKPDTEVTFDNMGNGNIRIDISTENVSAESTTIATTEDTIDVTVNYKTEVASELTTSETTYPESISTNHTFFDYEMAGQVLEMVNEERVRLGLAPLTMNYNLQKASDIRAKEIVVSFSHTRPDGSACITAISQVGVRFGYAGENIAVGYYTTETVMEAWINSEGHYANIVNPNYTQMAVSCYYDPESYGGYNWVQLFISD
ncbi:MAG: CAP domain-containing protein [Wujia sp.]